MDIILKIFWYIVFVWVIYAIYAAIEDTHRLIKEISNDVNDIKKKLRLPIEARTKEQRECRDTHYIWTKVMSGKTAEDLRKELGFLMFRRYKGYIDMYIADYPDTKICPDCKQLYGKHGEHCNNTEEHEYPNPRLISFKKFKEEHPDDNGWVDDEWWPA